MTLHEFFSNGFLFTMSTITVIGFLALLNIIRQLVRERQYFPAFLGIAATLLIVLASGAALTDPKNEVKSNECIETTVAKDANP